jgi:hypothetical protein
MNIRKQSPLSFVLLGLLPYTQPGLMLAFKPNTFFNELEKLSGHTKQSLQLAYARAQSKALITQHVSNFELSLGARQIVQPFIAKTLQNGGQLMITFDIPIEFNNRRRQLRSLLYHLGFKQAQQSVWISPMDHRLVLVESIQSLEIQDYVKLYEAAPVSLS